MRQQRPGAPWRKRVRRGHDAGSVDHPRPAVEPPAELRREEPEVVALGLGGGRSWEDLLSQAVDGDAADGEAAPSPGPRPVEAPDGADAGADTTLEDEPLAPIDLAETATDREAPVEAPTATPGVSNPFDVFGEVISDIVLPGGRRVTRYHLPPG